MKNKVGLLIQAVLLVGLLFSGILTICNSAFTVLFQIILMFFMFITAYNNHVFYKRKNYTEIYIASGFIIFLIIVIGMFS